MTTKLARQRKLAEPDVVAGNGLLDRRALLGRGAAIRRRGQRRRRRIATGAAAEPLAVDPWSLAARNYDTALWRAVAFRRQDGAHAERSRSSSRAAVRRARRTTSSTGPSRRTACISCIARGGFPDIDPAKHKLLIHGRVKQPMVFTLDALHRYPMVSRVDFLECGGNSAPLWSKDPIQANVQAIHGLVSCAEWTGVKLSTLFEEAGIDPTAEWFLAEGADAPTMHRSIPVRKAMDDAIIALYQNGERSMPSNGYPVRLLVPGYEGNMNVKWLRRIKVVDGPIMAHERDHGLHDPAARAERPGSSTSRRR